MRIAVINETSAADRNKDILLALDGLGHDVINAGMKKSGEKPELSYIHTGLMAAVLLNAGTVDFVVGGCGTGQGFLNSVMQYPGVTCGHIVTPLDAWLFTQINGGNCVSLMLNQGYGWAGDVNLRFIFEKLFCTEPGAGYPPHRKEPQRESRELLGKLNLITHRNIKQILAEIPGEIVMPVATYPGLVTMMESWRGTDSTILCALKDRIQG
jgi:ribose 5-phosphate isomerase RpiB